MTSMRFVRRRPKGTRRRRPAAGWIGSVSVALAGSLLLGAGPAGAATAARRPAGAPRVGQPGGASSEMLSPLSAADRLHGGSFLVKSDGARFEMRGFDYQPLVKVAGERNAYVNETFLPSFYNHAQVAAMLQRWEGEGYNTVRVFLNPGQIGNPRARGLAPAYVGNVADFVTTAQQHDVRTLVTVGALPAAGGYIPKGSPSFGTANQDYLDPAFLAAENRYLADLIGGLERDGAPLVDVLWELKGEQDWDNLAAPLSWKAGRVRTADGRVYDMAVAASRVAMENDNLVHWANSLTGTIHRLVPGSLVGVGVYPPSVHRPKWTVRPYVLFLPSTATDFVDVHVYPNLGPELAQVESFNASGTRKPVIMGEFGATRATSVAAAVTSLLSWQRASCNIGGLSVSGWLMWTWNSAADVEFWDALAGGGLLERALAPVNRPNPCA